MMSSDHHAPDQADGRALRLGETCWRIEPSERAALLIDNKSYFATLKEVLPSARRSEPPAGSESMTTPLATLGEYVWVVLP